MENIVTALIGIMMLLMGYMIGIRHKITLVHSYHYKRVAETDMLSFCRGVGVGNALVGVGLILFPIINMRFGEALASWIAGAIAVIGLSVALVTIIRYNKGLF